MIVKMKKHLFAILLFLLPVTVFCHNNGSTTVSGTLLLTDTIRCEQMKDSCLVLKDTLFNRFSSFKKGNLLDIVPVYTDTIKNSNDTIVGQFILKDSLSKHGDTLMLVWKDSIVCVYSAVYEDPDGGSTGKRERASWIKWCAIGIGIALLIILAFLFVLRFLKKFRKSKKFKVPLKANDITELKKEAAEFGFKIGKNSDEITITVTPENAKKLNKGGFIDLLKNVSAPSQEQESPQDQNKQKKGKKNSRATNRSTPGTDNYAPVINEIEEFINKLLGEGAQNASTDSQAAKPENDHRQEQNRQTGAGETGGDELQNRLKEYERRLEQARQKQSSGDASQSESGSETVQEYIKTLEEACDLVKNLIKERGNNQGLETTIASIKIDKERLENEKSNLDRTINDLKKNPRSFKGKDGFSSLTEIIEGYENDQAIRNDPESFKDKKGYNKLTKLIEKAEKCDNICNEPDAIDGDTEVGKLIKKAKTFVIILEHPEKLLSAPGADKHPLTALVRKGVLLDDVKQNPDLVKGNQEFAGSRLKEVVELTDTPEKVTKISYLSSKGLYKLVNAIEQIHRDPRLQSADYSWLNQMLSKTLANSSQYLAVQQKVAAAFGNNITIDGVIQNAQSYLGFGQYKNYWMNLQDSLLDAMLQLPKHSEAENTRVLLFYAAQLYSICCIMKEIYGDNTQNTGPHKVNVAVFNNANAPKLGAWNIPSISDSSMQPYIFTYLGGQDEGPRVNYLKQYKPLPFIFINNYYSDSVLS